MEDGESSILWPLRPALDALCAISALESIQQRIFQAALCCGLARGFMATHGGISPSFVRACSNQRGNFRKCLSQGIGAEMVWADPHEGSGWAASPRGAGAWRFGRDIALQFLYSNGLKRLLRGHEQMAKGISTIWLDTKSDSRWHAGERVNFPCVC